MKVELMWCGKVRVYVRALSAGRQDVPRLEAAVFAGKKGARCAHVQSFEGLQANEDSARTAARAALLSVMRSTPRGVDLTGISWDEDGAELDAQPSAMATDWRELVWADLESLKGKGWDVA